MGDFLEGVLFGLLLSWLVAGCNKPETPAPDYPECGDLGERCCEVEGSDPCAMSLKCVTDEEGGAKCVPDGWK